MSRQSPAAVRLDIEPYLQTVRTATGAPYYLYEPFTAPTQVYVTLFLEGYDAYYWNFTLRVYSPLLSTAQAAQETLDTMMPLLETTIPAHYGPMSWTIVFDETLNSLVAAWTIQVGRE